MSRQRALRRAGVALVGAAEHRPDRGRRRPTPCGSSPEPSADARLVQLPRGPRRGRRDLAGGARVATGIAGAGRRAGALGRHPARRCWTSSTCRPTPSTPCSRSPGRAAGSAFLIVCVPGAHGAEMSGALEALAAQMSLAIDGALLAEDLHRRRSEARFRSLVAHSSDLIAVLDRTGTVVYQSPSIEEVLGYTADEVMNTRFELLVRPSDRARLMQVVEGSDARARRLGHGRVQPAQPRRRVAPVRDPAHQSAERRARPGDRAQLPRHQRAQALRGPARPPGLPRPRHRARQPGALCRPRPARARPGDARAVDGGRDLHRPGRLQDDQRQPRTCLRRRRPAGGRPPDARPPCARPTPWPASAATSSPSWSRRCSARRRRWTSPSACSRR